MEPNKKPRRIHPLIQREEADNYLLLILLSFAASVSLTRLLLSLTGYPQIGGGELHIAHLLWGGLLLYAAALLPLLFANRGIYTAGALLAGTGVGLFIDEVGKFITQKNDYFYPIAASIVYLLFLVTIVLFLEIRSAARTKKGHELSRVFEDIGESLNHPLSSKEYLRLKSSLEVAATSTTSEREADLVKALSKYLEANATPAPVVQEESQKPSRLTSRLLAGVFSDKNLRVNLIVGLSIIGLLTLKNPISVALTPWLPEGISKLLTMSVGRHVEATTAPLWFSIRLVLEVVVGVLLLTSAGLLAAKRNKLGMAIGNVALLLSLTTVDILLFYFEQFSTIITTAIQFLLLIGIAFYRRRMSGPSRNNHGMNPSA
jgi:hypothetical protein